MNINLYDLDDADIMRSVTRVYVDGMLVRGVIFASSRTGHVRHFEGDNSTLLKERRGVVVFDVDIARCNKDQIYYLRHCLPFFDFDKAMRPNKRPRRRISRGLVAT